MATETWLLNDHFNFKNIQWIILSASFTSNGQSFSSIKYSYADFDCHYINYDNTSVYDDDGHIGWSDEAYRTIVLDTPAAGDLLTWLQANAVKQVTPRLSVDLTTAFPDQWAGLTIGKHTLQIRAKNPGNYLDSDLSTAIDFYKTVPITVTATNCTAATGNPTEFPDVGGGDTILTFNKKAGYTLPETIVITGVAAQNIGYSWTVAPDGQAAQLKILKALGNIDVTVTGVATTTEIDGGTYKWHDNAALTEWAQEINFTSNGASYSGMRYTGNGTAMTLQYMNADSEWQTVYNYDEDTSTGSWVNTAWQIVDLGTSAQTVTAIFKADFVANTTKQLATPQNVTADGTTVSWDEVENATSYAVLADGSEIGTVEGAPQEYTDCITFTGETSDFTLAVGSNGAKEWDGTVEYSTDHTTWTTWNGTSISSVDKKLYLRGSGNTKFWTSNGAKFVLSARAACSGNIQTLLEYSNPPTSIPTSYCYANMFSGCTNLTAAPALPATTLAEGCYAYMFNGCTSLTAAPELPATTLASFCYGAMFDGCTSLTQAPELPATTLTTYCYQEMFRNCSSLVQAPALPATTLATTCYGAMFNGCASLTKAPELPATTLADYCYEGMFYKCTGLKISSTQSSEYPTAWRIPSSGTISSTPSSWCDLMLANTGGTFASDPSINTTYYGAWTQTTPTLINFTIAGTSYQAEEGMTWEQWVNSSYNTDGYYVGEYGVYTSSGGSRVVREQNSTVFVMPSNTITNGQNYGTFTGGGVGN